MKKYISVLTIAGSDSGGGAGIQADLKTFNALGCYGVSAITAVTVQNTLGVTSVHTIPTLIVQGQIKCVMEDIKPSAIKIGMVQSSKLAITISETLKAYPYVPVIFDPVMTASSGHSLMEIDTMETLKKELFPLSQIITPNIDEAVLLSGIAINTIDDMKTAAGMIIKKGSNAVLIKGGHLKGPYLYDVFLDKTGAERIFKSSAINTQNTHGTGCTLSSAIAVFIALGDDILTAIDKAKVYTHCAIQNGKDVKTGDGHGPLNHFFDPKKMIINELHYNKPR